jgi:hypothetical protein
MLITILSFASAIIDENLILVTHVCYIRSVTSQKLQEL